MTTMINMPSFGNDGGNDGSAGGGNQNTGGNGATGGAGANDHSHVPLFQDGGNGFGFDENDDGDGSNNSDLDELFSAFGNGDGGDEGGDDDGTLNGLLSPEQQQQQVSGLEANVRRAISQMRIPDNAIPDDFDPNDRAQLTGVLNRVLQTTVQQAMGVVFQPVQVAMSHMAQVMDGTIDQRIKQARDGIAAQGILESQVPEVTNPKHRDMIMSMDQLLQSKGKKPAERAGLIRKMLNQMGINEGRGGGNGSNRRSTGGNQGGNNGNRQARYGRAALDSFFGAFNPPK